MRALVVEDEAQARETLEGRLRERGHSVVACESAEQALALHVAQPFSLVLIDWVLPSMDGLGLCRRIRGMPGGTLPVLIVITARSGASDLVRGLDAGADDYLTKPVEPELLSARIAVAERTAADRARCVTASAALSQTEASFKALIDGAPDGVLVHRDGRIIYANPSLLRLLGYEPSSLVGRSYESLVHVQDLPAQRARLAELPTRPSDGKPHELRLQSQSGAAVACEEVLIPLPLDGDASVASLLRDVSERKRMEQRLLLADRMVSVGTLAAGIAHEINNPLSYVMANLRFIQDEIDDVALALPPDARKSLQELLAQANDGAERVRVIIRDLKSFSRADAVKDGAVDITRVLNSAISMAWNEIRHRADFEKDCDVVPEVRGSEARLGQVFLNLLVNAAQAIPVGHASENKIQVKVRAVDDQVVVEVTDTGCGIPEENLHRIFDPFFTTKPVGVGTGLGLSICHNIVNSGGGEITVDSAVGRGTTFRVTLPRARRSVTAPRSLAPSLPVIANPRAQRLLVVDDEPSVVRSLQRALRGHTVVAALSGREALDVLDSGQRFDLVFCDLMMASLSGMELYEAVKRRHPGVEQSFVFMTGGAFTPQAREFLAGVPNTVLEKPFDIRALQRLVSRRDAAA